MAVLLVTRAVGIGVVGVLSAALPAAVACFETGLETGKAALVAVEVAVDLTMGLQVEFGVLGVAGVDCTCDFCSDFSNLCSDLTTWDAFPRVG